MRVATQLNRVEQADGYVSLFTNCVEIRVMFVTDDILRIRAGFDGQFTEASYSLVTTAWPDRLDEFFGSSRTRVTPATATLHEDDDKVVIQGARLRVEVDREPFRISVIDADGSVLHSDIPDLAFREDSNQRRMHTSRIEDDDRFYGFGEKSGEWNKAQKYMVMAPTDAMGYDPEETDSLYKHIPFYIKLGGSTRTAVGYFYHNTAECDFNMGRAKSNYWHRHSTYRTDAGDVDLFLIAGPSIREIVQRYTDLTGKSIMLPKAALGYLGSSMFYPELDADCDRAILDFVDTTKRKDIPVDGFQLSSGYTQYESDQGLKRAVFTWNKTRFPEPEQFFAEMTKRGITVSPNVKPGILLVHPDLDYMKDEGIFVQDSQEETPAVGTWWGGKGHFVDFTNDHARDVWKQMLKKNVLETGTSSVWNDNCEYDSLVDKDARVAFEGMGGTIGTLKAAMSNLMCHITVDAINETFPNTRPFVVCRSGHAGIQRYAQTWSGDNLTCWESLKYNIATILGMSLSGVANQGADICGFYGPSPEPELMVRWIQNGIFQPRFSIHSVNTDNTVTEPWMYSEHTDTIRDAIKLRYRLFPYLYSLMARAHRTGLPIMEPMCSAFQHDPELDEEGIDFMVGDALLVANVVDEGATHREVYLPTHERFYDFTTRASHAGGETYELPVDITSIPMFVRGGGIIPLAGNQLNNLTQEEVTDLHIICAPDQDGSFTLYEDDGATHDYVNGGFLSTLIDMRAGEQVLISFTHEGNYQTTVENVLVDVIHREKAPFWVRLEDTRLDHYLDRDEFERAESGWYYSQTLKSVQVKYPNPRRDYQLAVSFEQFDMIGM